MKVIGLISTAVLSLTLGVTAYAQRDEHADKQDRPQQQQDKHQQAGHEESRPTPNARQSERHEQGKHEEHAQQSQRNDRPQQHAQQQQSDRAHQQSQDSRQRGQTQERNKQYQHAQQRQDRPPQHTQELRHSAWQKHRSQHWESDHRTWQQRGGYRGYRIPEARYRGYFGRDHGFRITGLPFLVVGGYPRFQYSGYWFSPVDPWPEYWATNWYDTDDVYVMYVDNGYYMYNRRYPTTGIAIRISL